MQHGRLVFHLEGSVADIDNGNRFLCKRQRPLHPGAHIRKTSCLAAGQDRRQHFLYMVSHLLGRPVWSALRDGLRHLRGSYTSGIFLIGGKFPENNLLLRIHGIQRIRKKTDIAAEAIWIRQIENSLRAVHREITLIHKMALRVNMQSSRHSIFHLKDRRHFTLIRRIHLLSEFRAGRHDVHTGLIGRTDDAAHPLDRAEETGQRCQVVYAVIIENPCSRLPQKSEDAYQQIIVAVCRDRERVHLPQKPLVDGASGRLQSRTQKRVRRASEIQSPLIRKFHQFPGFLHIVGHGLFRIDMFARQQRVFDQLIVGSHRRQVDHHLYLGIRQHLLHRTCRDMVLIRLCLRVPKMLRGDAHHIQIVKFLDHVLQINVTDRP